MNSVVARVALATTVSADNIVHTEPWLLQPDGSTRYELAQDIKSALLP